MVNKTRILIGVGVLIILALLYFGYPILVHNINLSKFSANFRKISPPPASRPIGKFFERVGRLTDPESKHCDYFAGRLVIFEENEAEIKNYYTGKQIEIADSFDRSKFISDNEPVSINVYHLKNGHEPDRFPIIGLNPQQDFDVEKGLIDSDKIYLVYALQIGGQNDKGDLRCR